MQITKAANATEGILPGSRAMMYGYDGGVEISAGCAEAQLCVSAVWVGKSKAHMGCSVALESFYLELRSGVGE